MPQRYNYIFYFCNFLRLLMDIFFNFVPINEANNIINNYKPNEL